MARIEEEDLVVVVVAAEVAEVAITTPAKGTSNTPHPQISRLLPTSTPARHILRAVMPLLQLMEQGISILHRAAITLLTSQRGLLSMPIRPLHNLAQPLPTIPATTNKRTLNTKLKLPITCLHHIHHHCRTKPKPQHQARHPTGTHRNPARMAEEVAEAAVATLTAAGMVDPCQWQISAKVWVGQR